MKANRRIRKSGGATSVEIEWPRKNYSDRINAEKQLRKSEWEKTNEWKNGRQKPTSMNEWERANKKERNSNNKKQTMKNQREKTYAKDKIWKIETERT